MTHDGRTPGWPDVIARFYRSIDDGDLPAVVGFFAADAVYHRPGFDPVVGRDEIDRLYRERRPIRRSAHRLEQVTVDGHHVAVHGRFRGELADGRDAAWRFADFFEFAAGGTVVRRDTFFFTPPPGMRGSASVESPEEAS